MRLCRIATVPFFVRHHLATQIRATVAAGHEVHVVTSPEQEAEEVVRLPNVRYELIPIERRIAPLADLRSLVALWRCFRRARFDLVHSTTPKAGLLTAIAGALAGVPVRLHTFTGQAWKDRRGPVRWITKTCDRLIVALNTRCYADSASQRDFLLEHGIGGAGDIAVLGPGSLSGVDLEKFDVRLRDRRAELRRSLDIPAAARVIAFLGRVTRDKGIVELVTAFEALRRQRPDEDLRLLIVGPMEARLDPLPPGVLETISRDPAIRLEGYLPEPEKQLAVCDVFCLPSYREGFGNSVIEAAAMGVPTVASRIPGPMDSIIDGETGLLVPPRDAPALEAALARLLDDDALRERLGAAARERAVNVFGAGRINALLLAEYDALAARRRQAAAGSGAP